VFTFAWGLVMLVGGWIGPQWSDVTDITPAMWAAVRDIARLFTNQTFVAMAWQGALLAVGGLVLWGSSFLVRKPRPQE
jgi:predicted amidohydrolase